jgi:phenylpropionate dioxygenase-like ring-hydroxylating dioxygenase large terminal subunit
MIEETHWHPVASSTEVVAAPVAATLLDRAVVLWRNGAGIVQAWADQCPHRGAKLSLGQVVNGRLECGYHGWQFEAGGQCVHVPALPAFTPPPSHCARVYEACDAYGLVWVRLASTSAAAAPSPRLSQPLPVFAAEADAALHKLNCGPYDVATSAPRVMENFLDMAHFAFVHEGWLGASGFSAIDDYQITATPSGLIATGCKAWQPKSNLHSTATAQVEYSYEVTAPYTAVLTKVPEATSVAVQNYRESIALLICPVSPEHSRVWFRLAVADFASPDDKLRAFQHTIFMQDQPVLESQTPKRLPLDKDAERHSAADKTSAAYRRHLSQLGITFGVC